MALLLIIGEMQTGNPLSQEQGTFADGDVIQPVSIALATLLVIVISSYMSSLKHDMLDASLDDRPYRIKRKKIYTRFLKFIPLRFRITVFRS